ncbi:hypothetical protein FACS189421_09760 [Bacteroidia bacterium]|nr:hypothetical protein FACS189421_09760 [Bacteroidia bacterium]
MKRYLFFFAIIMLTFSVNAQTNSWKKVDDLEKQSLPKSALEVVNQIYQNALKTGNSPELLKAMIYQLKYETAIDNDQLPCRIREIEQFAGTDKNSVEQAVLYSLLTEIYFNYYQANASSINQRTAIVGDAPEDIREWAGNNFIQKITGLVHLSLLPAQKLQATPVSDYQEIMHASDLSLNLRPTLYDFLANRGIVSLTKLNENWQTQKYFPQTKFSGNAYFSPVKNFIHLNIPAGEYDFAPQIAKLYQQLLAFRLQENNAKALLIVDLDRLDFVNKNTNTNDANNDYLNALLELEKLYARYDFCVEILDEQASFYKDNGIPKQVYDICMKGIAKYPLYERIGLLQNQLNEITQSYLSVIADNVVYPGKELTLNINYKNIKKVSIEIYQIKAPVSVYVNEWLREGQYKKSGTLIGKREINLINKFPYLNSDTVIRIPVNGLGNYEYVVHAGEVKDQVANRQFSVSRLASISRAIDNQREFLVVDRMTGKPIENAQVNFYTRKNNALVLTENKSIITDKQGLAVGGNDKDFVFYNVSKGDDTALLMSSMPWISSYRDANKNTIQLSLFTDRSIYRPGQIVYFKGIAYETGKDMQQVVPNKIYTLTFRDANGKEVSNQKVKTNDFGSFNGEFTIPQGTLNGNFSIQSDANGGYATMKVEEYKRPTFDIQFDKNKNTPGFGDVVSVKGNAKTFSGINIQDATVQYKVTRQQHWMFRSRYFSPIQVAEGNVQTQADGSFEIQFTAEKAVEDKNDSNVFYTYAIEASVTDTNGETQSSNTYLSIGDKSMYLTINSLYPIVDKAQIPSVKINAFNLSGNPVPAQGTYEIYLLKAKANTGLDLKEEDWIQDKKIVGNHFESDTLIDSAPLKSLPSGRYRMLVKSSDDKGREIIAQQDFTMASTADKCPPVPVYEWLMTPKTTCVVGEKAEVIFGSSAKEVYVLYELFKDNKKIAASRFILNNENKKMDIPFLESYGDGITAVFSFVKDEKFFTQEVPIYKKQPDKTLSLNMEVFRDRLLPGQLEEWKISVRDADKNPVSAELLAGMYDASLDKIYRHSWHFYPIQGISLWRPYNQAGSEFNTSNTSLSGEWEYIPVSDFGYKFQWFGFSIRSNNVMLYGSPLRMKSVDMAMESNGGVTIGGVLHESPVEVLDSEVEETLSASQPEEVQIRQNFNETAFFYPQLKTNAAGETLISFTVPESNTTWKFTGLAHTQDLKSGQIVKTAVSQKKLMVTPNIPRFMREGDQTTLLSNISNLSEETLTGTVTLECFDPVTNKTNIVIPNASQAFSVEAGKTVPVSWTFDVPSEIDLATVKIVAKSPGFSDGEQHLVPVLPNRMLVTESLPLNVSGNQTRTFSFDKMKNNTSSTLENYRMTLEFTSNPVWYAVQALPSVTTPQTDNVLSWFAAYYSNTLATQIANSTPKIKQMIDVWTKQGGTTETLLSNLEKNQELKASLLEETPWILEAENESEQKQRLALLFDLNRSNNLTAQALDKLKALQAEDGGWSWFKGMNSSVSITQWILYGLGELETLKDFKELKDLKEIEDKAIAFIDRQFKQHFADLKKQKTNWKQTQRISTYELEYLFVRSFYKDIPLGDIGEAVQFYTGLAEKYWAKNTNLYSKALAAILLQRIGNTKTAQAVLKSLREHASHKPDFGMFWANNNTSCFMTQSATCVHTFIMEAFNEVGSTPAEMDEMKLWLLKQKQTQQWESVPATVNAINILLKTGTNWLESKGEVSIRLGDEVIDANQGEAGTGYLKVLKNLKSLKELKNYQTVTISKQDAGPAWGALYWQYFEDLDKITAAKTALNVEKSVISPNQSLKAGNKVTVRLTVRTDRDMEYVLLKDMRASCFEPVDQLSGIQWKQGLVYYQSPKDASMNFFFSSLPKGTYVFEYSLYVTAPGDYSNGITTIQCMYAPEFVSHTSGGKVSVK